MSLYGALSINWLNVYKDSYDVQCKKKASCELGRPKSV